MTGIPTASAHKPQEACHWFLCVVAAAGSTLFTKRPKLVYRRQHRLLKTRAIMVAFKFKQVRAFDDG